MARKFIRLARISWLLSGAGDQVLGLYDRLPERIRGWIEGAIIANVIAVITTVVFVAWGILSKIDPYWLGVSALVVLALSIWIFTQIQQGIEWLKRGAFEVTPVSGSGVQIGVTEEIMRPEAVYARIGVASKRDVSRCVAVVTAISVYDKHWALGPMIPLNWNSRYISWTPDENRLRRTTILKGITMTADLAVAYRSDPAHFEIASADNGARHKFPQGLYKVDLTVLSESGGGARRDVAIALTFSSGGAALGQPPYRLIVQLWSDEFVKQKKKDSM